MPQLLKEGSIVADSWRLQSQLEDAAPVPDGKLILPLGAWESRRDQLLNRPDTGVWLDSDEEPSRIADDLEHLDLLAINFPVFSDGRGYSYARLLRERYAYHGELRAIGDVLVDQLFFLKRCGFDAFALRDDQDIEAAKAALGAFSESYQAATDQAVPLFRRR